MPTLVLTAAVVLGIARSCTVADVPPENVLAVAKQESGFMPWVLHDDDASKGYRPTSSEQAADIAMGLMSQGHSVGVGLMQLTARSPEEFKAKFGLSVEEAAGDPCKNVRAGAALLAANYHATAAVEQRDEEQRAATLRTAAQVAAEQQAAEQRAADAALQRYNSGSSTGAPAYAASVVRIAARMPLLVPATSPAVPLAAVEKPVTSSPPPVPRWNLFARARSGTQSLIHASN